LLEIKIEISNYGLDRTTFKPCAAVQLYSNSVSFVEGGAGYPSNATGGKIPKEAKAFRRTILAILEI